jgi:hypothetical protein
VFVPDVASATPERVEGRAYVLCLCRTMYWYAAVHAVDARQPVGSAEVRAAVKPEPVVTEHVTASDVAAVVINEPLPPGRVISSDSAAAFARWYKRDASMYFSPRSSSEPPPERPK